VPVHLEYILTELLKNSFRATVEQHIRSQKHTPLPSIRITLAAPHPQQPNGFFAIRLRDQGGGVSATNMARIFSYAFTTAGRGAKGTEEEDAEDGGGPYAAQHVGGAAAAVGTNFFEEITGKGVQTGLGTIAGLGYGLPMSRLYAKFVSFFCLLLPLNPSE
jgi:26S proteasome regulatory subunit T1